MESRVVSVTDEATLLVPRGGNPGVPVSGIVRVQADQDTVFLGGSDVTASTGYPLAATMSFEFSLVSDELWGICAATDDADVNVITGTGEGLSRRHSQAAG